MTKYRAIKTTVDGITFDSKKEAGRYQELKLAQMAGDIQDLQLQPKFPIYIDCHKICTYVADFSYYRVEGDGNKIVEDTKGFKTPVYRLKKKLVEAIYRVKIFET